MPESYTKRLFHNLQTGKNIPGFFLAGLSVFVLLKIMNPLQAYAKYIQLDAVADVKTRFSSGCSSVQELANISQHRGIDVVIYSDRDRASLEFGVFPFERIIKKKREQHSILTSGATMYLSEINTNDKVFTKTLLIPAVESAPFYYWEGTLADKNLTAHNWDKHLLIVGLNKASDYEQLPILNSNLSLAYYDHYSLPFLILVGFFLVSTGLFYRRVWRKTFFFLMIVFLLLAINNHPFRSSPFDPYNGDKGIAPYQEVIDYVVSRNAMVFWNHLESTTGLGKTDSLGLSTLPHPEDLLLSKNYTGFEAVYDGEIHVTDPGDRWDQVLNQYIDGRRTHPVWGYGGNNFLCEGKNGLTLGGVRTVLLVKEKSKEGVLEAMRSGRMYALKQPESSRLSLDEFTISANPGQSVMGEELVSKDIPELKVKIRSTRGAEDKIILSIIRNGKLIKKETASLPYEMVWKDTGVERKGKVYYRLKAEVSSENYLVSNPIFVKFSDTTPQVASLVQEETRSVIHPTQAILPKSPKNPEMSFEEERKETSEMQLPNLPEAPEAPYASEDKVSNVLFNAVSPPSLPSISEPLPAETEPPTVVTTQSLELPEVEPVKKRNKEKFVVALIDGVTLKKGPGVRFSQTATAEKGEQLIFLRKLKATHNGKPWLEVKKDQRIMYVWGGLVKFGQ